MSAHRMTNEIPQLTLNNGVKMPVLGFGVYQIPAEQTEQAVSDALAAGYRSLDTAAAYQNEEAVGRAIAASGIPRSELFATTKLWIQDVGAGNAQRAFEASLKRLGVDYVDLYLIHQPFGDYYSSWREMQELNREGLAKAIGVSNFYPDRLVDLVANNEITPAVNQIETHPFNQRTADQAVMSEHGMQIESRGPFAEARTTSSPTRSSARSAPRTTSPSLRSSCAGSSSATSSSSPSPCDPSGCARTSASSTSSSPTTSWPASPPWTPAPRCSSTTPTPSGSAASTACASTDAEHGGRADLTGRGSSNLPVRMGKPAQGGLSSLLVDLRPRWLWRARERARRRLRWRSYALVPALGRWSFAFISSTLACASALVFSTRDLCSSLRAS
jgi:2,5-diketo-D-gluconate reductase A